MVMKAVVSRFLGTGSVSQDIGRVLEQGMKSPAMERMWVHGGTALGQALLKVLTGPAMKSFIADATKGLVQDQFGTTGAGRVLGSMAGNAASSLVQAGGTAASAAVGRAGKEELKNRSADIEAEKRAQERAEKDEENRKRLERVVSAYRYSDPRLGEAREGQYQKGSRWRKTALKQAEEQLKGLGYDREEDRLGILGVEKGRFGGMKDKPIDMSGFQNMPSESSADRAKREMVYISKTLVEGINESLGEFSKLDATPVSSETKAIDKLTAQQNKRGGITHGIILGASMKVADMAISGITDAASAELQNYTTSGMLASSTRNAGMDPEQYYRLMKSPGRQFGYTNQQALEATSAFAQTTNLSPQGLNRTMTQMGGFSNAYGLDLPTQAAAMAQAGSLGFIGVPGQRGQTQFGQQGLMGYLAAQYAGSSGLAKMDSFQSGLFDVSRIMQATTAAPANITGGGQFSVGNIYGTMNRSNNQALVGTQGGALLSQLSQGIANSPSTGPMGMLYYNILQQQGGAPMSPAAMQWIKENGIAPTNLGGHHYDTVQAFYQAKTKGALSQMDWLNRDQIIASATGMTMHGVAALYGGDDVYGHYQKGILDQVNARPQYQKRWNQLIKGHDITQTDARALQLVGDLAQSGNVSQFISHHKKELQNMHINTKGSAQDVANRLLNRKGTGDAQSEREAINKLSNTMSDAADKIHGVIKFLGPQGFAAVFAGSVGVFAKAVQAFLSGKGSTLLNSAGNAAGSFLGSVLGGGKGLLVKGGAAALTGLEAAGAGSAGAGAAVVGAATAGGLALGSIFGKAITDSTDYASWKKYEKSIRAFLASPAGRKFGVKSDLFGGLEVTDGKTSIPVKSWGEVHLHRDKKGHGFYTLDTTGNWFSKGQDYLIGPAGDQSHSGGASGHDHPHSEVLAAVRRHQHHIQRPGDPPLSDQGVRRGPKSDWGGEDMIITVHLKNDDGSTHSQSTAHKKGDKTRVDLHQRDPHHPKKRR